MLPVVLDELNNTAVSYRGMFGKSERDVADLLALGISSELVDSLSTVEANDLLKSLLCLKGKYHVAVSHSA